jgi:hypothetical protein
VPNNTGWTNPSFIALLIAAAAALAMGIGFISSKVRQQSLDKISMAFHSHIAVPSLPETMTTNIHSRDHLGSA